MIQLQRSRVGLPTQLRLRGQATAVALAIAAAVALLVNARLALMNTHAMRDASGWVEHTHQVLGRLQALLLSLQDAETGQRGFLITGEPSYLGPYEAGTASVEQALADLMLLARDSPEQQRAIEAVRPLVRSKMDELARTVGLRQGPGGAEAARAVVLTDQGKRLMDDIRRRVSEMMSREQRLLMERDRESARAASTAIVTTLVGFGAGLVLLVAAFASFRRRVQERGRAAAQLHEEKEQFRTTLASIGDAVIVTDTRGRITMLNRTAGAILGWDGDALGQPLEEVFRIVNEETRQPVESPVRKVLRDGQVVGLANHTVAIRRDGTDVPIDDSGAPVRGQDGAMVGVVLVFRDIRERREAERELQRRAELLEQQNQRKNEFLSVLSHELRNPLTPILNAVAILQTASATDDQARHAREVIARQVAHMSRLVEDLLDTARIAEGKVRLNRELVSFSDALRRTVDDHRSLFQKKGIALEVHEPPANLWVEADATRLVQVVGNLLHNAAKFTDPGGHVAVWLAPEDGRAVLRVRDDGTGMDQVTLGKIFQPFMQAENTLARTQGGLGLGLALAKRLVELQGGTVEAFSDGVGRGTEFVVALPLARSVAAAESPPLARAGPLRVVVIDDNEDATATLRDVLELEGHHVVAALDGRSGIDAALTARADVVLCDVGLPDIDGFEVARRLRAAGLRSRLVALTGYARPDDAQRALLAGFDDHLAKPADPDALVALLASKPAKEPPGTA